MNWNEQSFDWNHVRAFVAAAHEGSLSAAARALKQTQPTLSRQVSSLEETLGVTLFERGHRKLQLTSAGLELLEHANTMVDAANRISLSASGQSQDIEGLVSITATEMVATYYLPAMLKKLRKLAPGIVVKVVASDEVRDLMRREADIAIRHAQPLQPDLIARKIGTITAHVYASKTLLDEIGEPINMDNLAKYDFVGVEDTENLIAGVSQQGLHLRLDQFRAIAGSGNCMLQMIREGLGLGFLPTDTAQLFDDLVPVLCDQFKPEIPVWLVTHRELKTSRRIRLVYDLLAEEIPKLNEVNAI